MPSDVNASLKILGLKVSAIKTLNVFGKRSEAEKIYNDSVSLIGVNRKDFAKELIIANENLRKVESWKTLCSERMRFHICKVCSKLTKIEHLHCPDCTGILRTKLTWPDPEVGFLKETCQKCHYLNKRVIDDPDEVALLRESTK